MHTAYGNGLRPEIWETFRNRFGIQNILEFYGASESVVSTWNYNSGMCVPTKIMHVMIVDKISGPEGVGSVGRYGLLQRFLTRNDLIAVRVDPETQEPIRNKSGLCVAVQTDEPGEMLMRIPDPSVYAGYYQDPVASRKKIINGVLKQGDSWFRCGDLLQRNKDGYWYFVDRIGDTFRWKSENVSTSVR